MRPDASVRSGCSRPTPIDVEVVRHSNMIAVRVGDVVGVVHRFGDAVFGRMWDGDRSISTT